MSCWTLFSDESSIRDFLYVDGCCKLTDKVKKKQKQRKKVEIVPLKLYCVHLLLPSLHQYLLAMTFVYFKRACFTITEYTTKNFFLAL